LSELERVSLMFDIGEVHRARYARIKRIGDVVAGLIGLGVLAIVTPAVALANLFGNRGPTFYRQERVGRGTTSFTILKFRTMRPESADGDWTVENDPRITRVGAWLRRT